MERLKILALLVLLLGVFWAVSPSSPVIYNKSDSNPKIIGFVDFMFYYNAAKLTGGGEASEIYNQDLQQKNMSAIIGAPVKELIPYLYPPQSLLFFLPISGMSLQTSFLLWQGFNSIALLLIPFLIYLSGIAVNRGNNLLISSLLIATCYPLINGITQGQVTILMTLGIWGYYVLAQKKHFIAASVLMILTAFKPQLILAPVIYSLIVYGKRLWISSTVAAIAVVVVCLLLFGAGIWQSYAEILISSSGKITDGASLAIMANIRTLALFLFGHGYLLLVNVASSALWVLGVVISAIIAFILKNKSKKMQELGFGLVVTLSCFVSPWLHVYNLMLLIIPVAYLIKYVNFTPRPHFIAGLINFNLLSMFIAELAPQFNALLWVPTQLILMVFIIYKMRKGKNLLDVHD